MAKGGPTNLAPILSGQGTNDLRDIKPPVEIPNAWLWAAWAAGAILLLAVLWAAWRYWRKRREEILAVPPVPPHVRAKQKLQEALALLKQPREFCILVSDTVRWYLEERFDFRAPERTTEEFLYELQGTNLLTPDQKASLGEFLQRCDLVKFARYEPGEPELRDLHASALRLVEETEPVEPPPGSQPPTAAYPQQTGENKTDGIQTANLDSTALEAPSPRPSPPQRGEREKMRNTAHCARSLPLPPLRGRGWARGGLLRELVELSRCARIQILTTVPK